MKAKQGGPAPAQGAKRKQANDPPASGIETSVAPSSWARWVPWILVGLVVVLAASVRIRLLDIPLERDEGEYAFAGQLLLGGTPPYREAFSLKFPGIYGAYALSMAIFGHTIAGVHLGLLLVNAGTIVLVFLLGRRLFSTAAGVAASATYALLSLGAGVYGTQAHATHFVVAAALGASLLLLRATDSGSRITLFWSGLLYGVAVLMKQHGVFFALFGCLYLLVRNEQAKLRQLAILIGGMIVPLALTAFALLGAGVFGNFWFWTVTYAREYVTENSLTAGWTAFTSEFSRVVGPNLILWILAGAAVVMLWWKKQDRVSAVFVTAFLAFSFLAVCPGFYFRGHYFVLMLPAVALLAGSAMVSAGNALRSTEVVYVLYGAMLMFVAAQQSNLLFHFSALEASRELYGQNPFPEAIGIGAYLRDHTAKGDRIAVLGSEPEIFFYAGRHSATGHIYTYGLMEPQPYAVTMQNQMIRDIETVRPSYVVFVNHPGSWLQRPDSSVRIFEWWQVYREQHYTMSAISEIISQDVAELRTNDLEGYRPRSPLFVSIYKRVEKP